MPPSTPTFYASPSITKLNSARHRMPSPMFPHTFYPHAHPTLDNTHLEVVQHLLAVTEDEEAALELEGRQCLGEATVSGTRGLLKIGCDEVAGVAGHAREGACEDRGERE